MNDVTTMVKTLGGKMNIIPTDVIVVSLPRTGTLSMTKMLILLGFPCTHVPGPGWKEFLDKDGVRALSDTPMFRPSVIQHALDVSDNVKFIYISKTPDAWVESMIKVNLSNNFNGMCRDENKEKWNIHTKIDFESLSEILKGPWDKTTAGEYFEVHEQRVKDMIPNDRLLVYTFDSGWEPLCDFLDVDVPSDELPHLNKDTMFDKLI